MKKTYIITPEFNNKPLWKFLKSQGYSEAMLKTLRQQGGIEINDEFHRQVDPVTSGGKLTVTFPEKATSLVANSDLKITIAYEDEDIIVFDKPDDMLVHPAAKGFDDALGNYFMHLHPNIVFRPLGRLDRHTTGLCLIAKNRLTAVQLNHNIDKEYIALVEGNFSEDSGTVNAPLIREAGSIIRRRVDLQDGQASITHYWVLERFKTHTLLRLKLETGRTHQIRVHMAYLGHPLAGDDLYGGHKNIMLRQALHCKKITFFTKNQEVTVNAQTPPDLRKAIKHLQNTH